MASTTLYSRIKAAVVQTIKDLNLPNLNNADDETMVDSQIDLDTDGTNLQFPCVVCITAGLTEEMFGVDNQLNGFVWPVGVMIVNKGDGAGGKDHENESKYLGWRKAIIDAFNRRGRRSLNDRQNLPAAMLAVPEIVKVDVVPRMIFDPKLSQYQLVRSSLLLRVEAIERR